MEDPYWVVESWADFQDSNSEPHATCSGIGIKLDPPLKIWPHHAWVPYEGAMEKYLNTLLYRDDAIPLMTRVSLEDIDSDAQETGVEGNAETGSCRAWVEDYPDDSVGDYTWWIRARAAMDEGDGNVQCSFNLLDLRNLPIE